MHARKPGIQLDQGKLNWSKIPEFSIAYNGYSVVIPHVEHYLNKVMHEVRLNHCDDAPELKEDLNIFIKQEAMHAKYHMSYNKRIYDEGYEGLKPMIERLVSELEEMRQKRSLAFNAGFESIATGDAQYLFLKCDKYFEDADPHGANLLLWHVAEEYEHRAVCWNAFYAVSKNYFMRLAGMLYAFWHVGGTFLESEKHILAHHRQHMTEKELKKSKLNTRYLFWRQMAYVGPRMLRLFLPTYNPENLKVPDRVHRALKFFDSSEPLATSFEEVVTYS